MIDTIATITTYLEDGNFWLALGNAIGSSTMALLLALKAQVNWSWIETMITALVIVCLTVWYTAGEQAGIVASSLAVVLASVPQMVETYNKPWATPAGAYIIFLTANIISFIAGKSWTIEERFYSGCSIFLCAVIVLFTQRKKLAE
jgi:hypothetical protein